MPSDTKYIYNHASFTPKSFILMTKFVINMKQIQKIMRLLIFSLYPSANFRDKVVTFFENTWRQLYNEQAYFHLSSGQRVVLANISIIIMQ